VKKVSAAVSILVLLVLGILWASPYFTLFSIAGAIVDNDPGTLGEKVDFPALKGSLKNQIRQALPKPEAHQNSRSTLGKVIGSKMGEWIIDAALKPDTVIVLAREALHRSANGEELKSPWRRAFALVYRGRSRYDDLSTFSYRLPVEGGEILFEFKRSGLSWKMTNALIPPERLKEVIQNAIGGKTP
jgi:hypothetical protein